MTNRRQFVVSASTSAAALALPSLSTAQSWPSQILKIVVPYAPGGSSDLISRLVSKPLGDLLGATVVVENKTGNNGHVGATLVAQATDQHTLLLSDMGSLAIGHLVAKDLAYKPEDLQGVTMLAYSPHMLVVHPSVPANNLAELVAFSKRTRLNVASSGSGSVNHLGVVDIALATGLQWQHVPYRGGAQALADTAAGVTHAVLNGMLATLPQVNAGRLKVIGISKRTRMALVSAMPTIAEQGLPNFESGTYQGVAVSSSMPKPLVEKLNAALIKVIRSPELRARMVEAGAEVMTSTPAEMGTFFANDRKRWSAVIQKAGKQIEGTV